MARNGSGAFNRIYNWVVDSGNSINIDPSRMDTEFDGIATALSGSIAADGQTTITANIPFNSKKLTGLANGSARTDSITLGQVQDGTYGTLGTLGGSANTYTASPTPSITAYATGSEFNLKVNADNTGATTLNISTIGVKAIKKYDGAGTKVALEAGDLQQDQYYKVVYDGTDFVLIGKNPSTTSTVGQSLLPNPITISNGTDAAHDIDFTAGNFQFDDGSGQSVATALTKQIDASWVAGNNAGGLDTGAVAIDEIYYMFAIYNPTTLTSDFLFSLSATSPTLPSGYTKKKKIASLTTDGSGNIRNGSYVFNPNGSYAFIYNSPISFSTTTLATTRTAIPMDCPPNTSVRINAKYQDNDASAGNVIIFDSNRVDAAPTLSNSTLVTNNNLLAIIQDFFIVDSSSQLFYRAEDSTAILFEVANLGWFDNNL